MPKILFCLNRKPGMTHREFGEYWYREHVDLATEMPGLVRYDLSFPENPDEAAYDGMAELYFKSEGALETAMDSTAGREAAADLQHFADTDDILQLVLEPRTLYEDGAESPRPVE